MTWRGWLRGEKDRVERDLQKLWGDWAPLINAIKSNRLWRGVWDDDELQPGEQRLNPRDPHVPQPGVPLSSLNNHFFTPGGGDPPDEPFIGGL